MKNSALIAALAIALTATAFAQSETTNNASVEKAITAVEQQWADADVKADAAKLSELMADDLTDVSFDGATTTKAQDVDALKSGAVKFTEVTNSDLKVRSYGDIAVDTGIVTLKGTAAGKDISGRYAFTDVWKNNGGKWQCVASQITPTK